MQYKEAYVARFTNGKLINKKTASMRSERNREKLMREILYCMNFWKYLSPKNNLNYFNATPFIFLAGSNLY